MSNKFILGLFHDEDKLVHTAELLYKNDFKIYDIYTPFPLHGLDELLGIKRTKLPWVTFIAGIIGLLIAMSFQIWTSYADWPLNVGGKPLLSIPAFIPVAFEIMVLLGALTTVLAFLCKSKLFPGKEIRLMDHRQTDDQFVLALERSNAELNIEKMKSFLLEHGASSVKIID